ncbi:MAG: hypothetical protein ABS69_00430 [Nitrosomonadales bacterium SCN 54-20]|nr:MAG: hypothetical protein ABS69_00430 [Nitrosomonadales bacterium SCN 54-20]
MAAPNTAREALIAEMLGDLDSIIQRAERLPAMVDAAEGKLTATAKALESAGDKYRLAVTAFNEEAKAELSEYLDRKTTQAVAKTLEENKAAMQDAARLAFRSEASEKAANLGIVLADAAKIFRRSMWSRVLEHAITAMIASATTAALVYLLLRNH